MMRKTRFAAIASIATLSLLLAAACGSSPTRPTPPVIEPPVVVPPPPAPKPTLAISRILAFGDSLTQGGPDGPTLTHRLGLADHTHIINSYPTILQRILDETYGAGAATVTNAGLGGEHAIGSGTEERLIDELNFHEPDLLLLMHGVNSLNAGVRREQDDDENLAATAEAVAELIETAYERRPGIHVMLATLPRQKANTSDNTVSAYLIPRYNDAMREVAAQEGATLVDIYQVITEAMLAEDGLHITAAGYQAMAETFYAAIKAKYHQEPTALR